MKNEKISSKKQILIVDDSLLNRELLADILSKDYEIVTASDGMEALSAIQSGKYDFSVVLLDIVMPNYDGFYVLSNIKNNKTLKNLPILMISSDSSNAQVKKAYELGAFDYITRPFDAEIVKRRISNAIIIYTKQRQLEKKVIAQFQDHQRYMNIMVSILCNVVEFRDNSGSLHIKNIMQLTKIMLKKLTDNTDKYVLSEKDKYNIYYASALHDLGKISIPDEILNKPGRLTPEEFEVMKTHCQIGANIIKSLPSFQDESFLQTAYDICLHHHEKYDGKGYPCGLKGDEIPISAQIVSLVDVYDALTSPRCYKRAFTHEEALQMILNGECGVFNPILMDLFMKSEKEIQQQKFFNPFE